MEEKNYIWVAYKRLRYLRWQIRNWAKLQCHTRNYLNLLLIKSWDVYAHNSPHEPIYEIIASKMQQKRGLKLAQTERVTIFFTCNGSRTKWGSYACWILTVELIFRKYNHWHNAQFPRLSPHPDLDLPTQTCSPAPVCSLMMHMASAARFDGEMSMLYLFFAWC
jgi:hypothetical protein